MFSSFIFSIYYSETKSINKLITITKNRWRNFYLNFESVNTNRSLKKLGGSTFFCFYMLMRLKMFSVSLWSYGLFNTLVDLYWNSSYSSLEGVWSICLFEDWCWLSLKFFVFNAKLWLFVGCFLFLCKNIMWLRD